MPTRRGCWRMASAVGRTSPSPRTTRSSAAALALLVSFAVLAVAWRTSKFRGDESGRPLPARLAAFVDSPVTRGACSRRGLLFAGWIDDGGAVRHRHVDQPDLRRRLRPAVGRAGAGRAAVRTDLPRLQPAALDPPRHLPADAGRLPRQASSTYPKRARALARLGHLVRLRLAGAGQPESTRPTSPSSCSGSRSSGCCCCSARPCSATCGSPAPTRSRSTRRWSRGCRRSAGVPTACW